MVRGDKKMKNMKVERYMLWIGALLAVLLVGCEDLGCDMPGGQPVYFEYHYTNHAWGYHENGWIIDREGNIAIARHETRSTER